MYKRQVLNVQHFFSNRSFVQPFVLINRSFNLLVHRSFNRSFQSIVKSFDRSFSRPFNRLFSRSTTVCSIVRFIVRSTVPFCSFDLSSKSFVESLASIARVVVLPIVRSTVRYQSFVQLLVNRSFLNRPVQAIVQSSVLYRSFNRPFNRPLDKSRLTAADHL